MKIAVLGTGAFGTALAKIFSEVPGRAHEVTLWCRGAEAAMRIRDTRESSHLPGTKLSEGVGVSHELEEAVAGRGLVIMVTPSQTVRDVLGRAAPFLAENALVVSAAKGIEQGTLSTMDQVFGDVLPAPVAARAAFLSGPTFAKELVRGLPAAIVVASHDAGSRELIQAELGSELLRIYSTNDVIGVELAGALKNIYAIGAGICDGLGFGNNTRAAMITRGLAEMSRLGVRMGADPLTFAGLAGIGDLVLTCTGDLSRNRNVGLELGRGRAIADIVASMDAVAEGVKTTRAAHELAARHGVDVPIVSAIYRVIEQGATARDAVAGLLRREVRGDERL